MKLGEKSKFQLRESAGFSYDDLAWVFSQILPKSSEQVQIVETTPTGGVLVYDEHTWRVSPELPWPRYVSCDFGTAHPTVILWRNRGGVVRAWFDEAALLMGRAVNPPTIMAQKIRGAVARNFARRRGARRRGEPVTR